MYLNNGSLCCGAMKRGLFILPSRGQQSTQQHRRLFDCLKHILAVHHIYSAAIWMALSITRRKRERVDSFLLTAGDDNNDVSSRLEKNSIALHHTSSTMNKQEASIVGVNIKGPVIAYQKYLLVKNITWKQAAAHEGLLVDTSRSSLPFSQRLLLICTA